MLLNNNIVAIQLLINKLVIVSNITILLITISILLSFLTNLNYFNKYNIKNALKKINTELLLTFFIILSIKILLNIYINNNLNESITYFLQNKTLNINIQGIFNNINSNFSDCILLLAYITGYVCKILLGEKNIIKTIPNLTLFSLFLLITIIMVSTSNILIMFISFEFIFIPTIYFVYVLGYTKKIDGAIKFLFTWTLFGAFLVLISLMYVYAQHNTLNYYNLININFTDQELFYIGFSIFIGFGVKIPIFPFHYWLTKIHVEAPAGFSIFLSGFLVKASLYCLSILISIFLTHNLYKFIVLISFIGIIEASCKLWIQTDFKKIVAFATIQEMNIILVLLISCTNIIDYLIITFILMHGLLSTLMFYIVDIIQKKTKTRNVVAMGGIAKYVPILSFYIWLMALFSLGFPLTIKFVAESFLVDILISSSFMITGFTLLFLIFIGTIGLVRQIIIILYNIPSKRLKVNSFISKKDKLIICTIIFFLIFLNLTIFLNYY